MSSVPGAEQPLLLLLDAFPPGRHALATAIAVMLVPTLLWLSGLRFQWRRDRRETRESIAGLMGRLVDQQRAELVRLVAEADALRSQIDLFTEGRWQLQLTLDDLRDQVIAGRMMIHDYERRLQLPETEFPQMLSLQVIHKPA